MQITCDEVVVGDRVSGLSLALELALQEERDVLVIRLPKQQGGPQMAVRPHVLEFDSWSARGCEGWAPEQVLPLYKRIERDFDFGQLGYHGLDGPLGVRRSAPGDWTELDRGFRAAALEKGHPWAEDHNAPGVLGVSPLAWTGTADHAVPAEFGLEEALRAYGNVRFIDAEQVHRVVFEGTRAVGISISISGSGAGLSILAGEIILATGAIDSAAILQRSGIGPADELRAVGVAPLVDAPVGKSLQVHPVLPLRLPAVAWAQPPASSGRPQGIMARWNTGLEGTTSGDLMAWTCNGSAASQASLLGSLAQVCSRGQVRISGAAADDGVRLESGMLLDPLDAYRMRLVYRHLTDLSQRPGLSSILGGVVDNLGEPWDPELAGERLDLWLRSRIEPLGDYAGTCRMGAAEDPNTVADGRGRVKGTQCLRLADSSLQPELVKAAPVLTEAVIGRRIAAMILGERAESSRRPLARRSTSEILR